MLTVDDVRKHLGLSRHNSYALAKLLGLRIRGRRLLIPRARLQAYFEGDQAQVLPSPDDTRRGRLVG